tara:strand:+ start:256 stop:894 length:639 start_codon:yes stop_codon:yes gene_type:complete
MANYLSSLPNLKYPSLNPKSNSLFDLDDVKNFFVRLKIREDIFQNLSFNTKYKIKGNERPDNVADKIYGNPRLDWIVLLSNNIIDVYNEWPIEDFKFYEYLDNKYKEQSYTDIAYYETTEIRDSQGRLLLPAGLRVDSTFTFTNPITNSTTSPIKPVLFLDIERKKNDAKRNIVLLRSQYAEKLSEEFNSLRYGRSSQFINRGIKLVSNPNL